MAIVGPSLLMAHIPRTAGRSAGRMLEAAGLGTRVHPIYNHERMSELLARFGDRPVRLGILRDPVGWYASMAVSTYYSHQGWARAIYGRAARDPAALLAAMVDPEAHDVPTEVVVDEPDAEMLRPEPGLSLYASNYLRIFLAPSAVGLSENALRAMHEAHSLLTHLVRTRRLLEGLRALFGDVFREEVRYREAVPTQHRGVWNDVLGPGVVPRIRARDGWLHTHYDPARAAVYEIPRPIAATG